MDGESANNTGGIVLIVDDDYIVRLLARESLEQAGFTVAETEDGRRALDVFEEISPDIVLLDVVMPEVDGFAVCRRIREHPEGWHTPILMMTGLDDVHSIKHAYDMGATDFMTKPLNFLVLSYRLRYMMRARQTLQDLSISRTNLNHAQRLAQIGSWEWDVKRDVLHWSEAIYRIYEDPFGFGRSYHAFLKTEHPLLEDALPSDNQFGIDHQITLSDGTTRYVHTEAKIVNDQSGCPVRMTGTVQDITERKQHEDQIRKLAYYDSLTGLPNRLLFKENLLRILAAAGQNELKVATMFLDMDHFKNINDSMGHDVGDRLLQCFAKRLTHCVRGMDRGATSNQSICPVARLGGDEFTIILDDVSRREDAADVARRIVDEISKPFDLDGREVAVTVSIGISLYPDDGGDIVTLLKNADIAMYQAKEHGRNTFNMFNQ